MQPAGIEENFDAIVQIQRRLGKRLRDFSQHGMKQMHRAAHEILFNHIRRERPRNLGNRGLTLREHLQNQPHRDDAVEAVQKIREGRAAASFAAKRRAD